jgi:hypothetical protein
VAKRSEDFGDAVDRETAGEFELRLGGALSSCNCCMRPKEMVPGVVFPT